MDTSRPPIIRICPEHLCRLFNDRKIWERAVAGELQYHIESKRKEAPLIDVHGNECWITELLFVTDPNFPIGDPRHDVALDANRHKTDAGVIGGSGKWDPGKGQIQLDGKIYAKFRTRGGRQPHCELCEEGDMIHPSERFRDSVYRPSIWRYRLVRLRSRFRRIFGRASGRAAGER
jgi:hypothetical protein